LLFSITGRTTVVILPLKAILADLKRRADEAGVDAFVWDGKGLLLVQTEKVEAKNPAKKFWRQKFFSKRKRKESHGQWTTPGISPSLKAPCLQFLRFIFSFSFYFSKNERKKKKKKIPPHVVLLIAIPIGRHTQSSEEILMFLGAQLIIIIPSHSNFQIQLFSNFLLGANVHPPERKPPPQPPPLGPPAMWPHSGCVKIGSCIPPLVPFLDLCIFALIRKL